jgi:succinate dehydrogenase/fumarate reductase cytochrome b subunit
MKETTVKKLRRFNMIMGGLHLIQGVLMIFLATSIIQKIGEFSPKIIQFYLSYNIQTKSLETTSRVLFELPFGILVAVFLLLSALAHALISIPKKLNEQYNNDLSKGMNKFRWFEYALSSSVMIVLISTLFGIYDIGSLILIFIVNATMNLFGLVMEQLNSKRTDGKTSWGPFIWGSIAGITPWAVILIYMFGTGNLEMVPWFVWAIVGTYFVAFNTFPINMILQYKKVGKWKDYLYGERTYIVLSLVAKTLLAWLVLFGAMQP